MDTPSTIRTADDCRERARRFFALAVAEDDLERREAWLIQGERWMQRWRYWTPSQTYIDHENAVRRRQ